MERARSRTWTRIGTSVAAAVAVIALAGGCSNFDSDPDVGDICSAPGATIVDEHGQTLVCR